MSKYHSNVSLGEAAQLLNNAKHVLLTTHAKPDGDAFGSVVALDGALRLQNKEVHSLLIPPVSNELRCLDGFGRCKIFTGEVLPNLIDLVVIVDTGAWSQIEPLTSNLKPILDKCLIIDHHQTGDIGAKYLCIDSNAAATCEIIAELFEDMTPPAQGSFLDDPTISAALFTGIATDTGWFRFSNTSARTFQWAAKLLDAGVVHTDLYRELEQKSRPQKLALKAIALKSCQYLADGQAALMVLTDADFAQTEGRSEDMEQLVNVPLDVEQIQVSVLVSQQPVEDSVSKESAHSALPISVSFRSKPGLGAIDVSKLANKLGGGGHQRAAGAKIYAPLSQTVEQLISVIEAAFGENSKL